MNARWMSRRFGRSLILSCLMFAPMTTPAFARPVSSPSAEAQIARCIRQASGGHLWLERTLWGLRDQEAGWIGAEIANSNGSHDLGPMQVNSLWIGRMAAVTGHARSDVRRWLIHDPCYNVAAARWIFLSALSNSRDYWRAIGLYHSPTGWRQQKYSRKVAVHLASRYGIEILALRASQ